MPDYLFILNCRHIGQTTPDDGAIQPSTVQACIRWNQHLDVIAIVLQYWHLVFNATAAKG